MKRVRCQYAMEQMLRKKNVTQADLATRLGMPPQNQSAISRTIRGSMSLKTAERYTAALGYQVVFIPAHAALPPDSYALDDLGECDLSGFKGKPFLTTADISEQLGISRQVALREMRKSGCPMRRIGRTFAVNGKAFGDYVRQRNDGKGKWIDGRALRHAGRNPR